MGQYLMGLDNGGSIIKCALFDLQGNEIAVAERRVELFEPKQGFTERDPGQVWNANKEAIREVIEISCVQPEEIKGVAVAGYGNGICLLDDRGDAVYPIIVSTDSRATSYVNRYAKDGTLDKVYKMTHQDIWAAQPIALLAWFRDHEPKVLEKTACVQFIKDFVRYRLTGNICGELTDASGTNLFNLEKKTWDHRLFELGGIDFMFDKFPQKILNCTDIAGRVSAQAAKETGLAEGTPVAGGLFDIDACCASSGILADDTLCVITGTWSINEYITPNFNEGNGKYSTTHSYMPGYYLIAESSPTSASNLDWYLDNIYSKIRPDLSRERLYEHCNELISSIGPQESDLIFVPYLFSSSSYPSDRGAFFNLSNFYNGDHVLRAVYEGIVFSSCYHVERVSKGHPFTKARLSGGVAKSPQWSQMMADALGLPLEVMSGAELGALGAAMCAGICTGVFKDFFEAAEAMVHIRHTYIPDYGRTAVYREKFERFKAAIKALDMFHQSVDK